jgi:hypothetical protein
VQGKVKFALLVTAPLLVLVVVLLPIVLPLFPSREQGQVLWWREELKKMNVPISFWGRVVDENGQGVSEAEVRGEIVEYTSTCVGSKRVNEVVGMTDAGGRFELKCAAGARLSIESIERQGYEFMPGASKVSIFCYTPGQGGVVFVPNKEEPVAFHVRKKGVTALLLHSMFGSHMTRPTSEITVDLVNGIVLKHGREGNMRVTCEYSEERGEYSVCLEALGEDPGIVENQKIVYVAPAEGYEVTCRFTVGPGRAERLFCVKSGTPCVYTRLKVDLVGGESLDALFDSWLNPYGERILEAETELQGDDIIRLRAEAFSALREGCLPKKPDLGSLIGRETK